MKQEILVSFVTFIFLFGFACAAYGEVPCKDGYTYACDAYRVCGCTVMHTTVGTTTGDVVAVGELDPYRGQDGSDLLIWNNGDGADFHLGGSGNDTLLGGRGSEEVELLIELGLAAGLSPEEILIGLLVPAVQGVRE